MMMTDASAVSVTAMMLSHNHQLIPVGVFDGVLFVGVLLGVFLLEDGVFLVDGDFFADE